MGWESSGVVRFDLGPLLQGQMRIAKLKSAHNSLIIGLRGLGWQTNLQEIMGWESLYVVRFDPSKVKQGYPNLKVLKSCLLLVLEACNLNPTYRKSWAGNLLMWSDLTLGPSFEVKQG